MRIVRNDQNNHLEEVKDLFGRSSEVIVASPFISPFAINNIKRWITAGFEKLTLVTTLKERDADQLRKVPVLQELYQQKKQLGYRLMIGIDNQLHGKVYIGLRDGKYMGAVITSANFTENGLVNNHEWGVYLADLDEIEKLHQQILSDINLTLSEQDLKKMKQWMDENAVDIEEHTDIGVSFVDMIAKPGAKKDGMRYWLKPLGKSPNPLSAYRLFGEDVHRITFSKKNSSGVREGDILIAYSVVSQQLISVFVATDARDRLTKFDNPGDKQWPNYIMCRNETPTFGANWPKINRTLSEMRTEFLLQNPTGYVLASGKNKFNGLQWGADHVQATKEFAEFVIGRMKEVECAYSG